MTGEDRKTMARWVAQGKSPEDKHEEGRILIVVGSVISTSWIIIYHFITNSQNVFDWEGTHRKRYALMTRDSSAFSVSTSRNCQSVTNQGIL